MTAPGRYWVTGASTGIGRALAAQLLAEGHRVAVSARSTDKLASLAQAAPDRCLVLPLDVTDAKATAEVVATVFERFGGLDVAILNAGTYALNKGDQLSAASFEATFDVNLFGVVRALEVLIPRMERQPQGGQIAMTSSLTGYIGLPHGTPYSATKAALISMAETLRAELAPRRIAITVINPGFVRTPLTDRNDFPMPFLIEPEEAARIILKRLPRKPFEIRFPRAMVLVMQLLRLLPYALYFRLARRLVRRT